VILEADSTEKREKMLALIDKYNIAVLAITDKSDELALRYIPSALAYVGSITDNI